jgi:hypothetical protein
VLDAEVAWTQGWEDSVDIPRFGLRFTHETFPEALLEALGDPSFVTSF